MTVTSTFNTSTEGWTVMGATGFVWNPDGAGGGYIIAFDARGSQDLYFIAPEQFLGDRAGYYGGILGFDLMQSGGSQWDARYDVILIGGSGLQIYASISNPAVGEFTRYAIPLVAADGIWRLVHSYDGATPASEAQIREVLGDLARVEINGEFVWGDETTALDNVVMQSVPVLRLPTVPGGTGGAASHPTLANALANAAAGDRIIVNDPASGGTVGRAVADNLHVSAPEGYSGRIYLGPGVTTITLGGEADFRVAGNAAANVIRAGDGALRAYGNAGADVLTGGAADDWLQGGADGDSLTGGAGDDTLIGGSGNDTIEGGDGDDVLNGQLDHDFLAGGAGNDALLGSFGADTLMGEAGNDTLGGQSGDDILRGNEGEDLLIGGFGNDGLAGGTGNDTLDGGGHNDLLDGESGDDLLRGGGGNDSLRGMDGRDTLNGGEQADLLMGDEGDDLLRGDAGQDTLNGGAGNDTLTGGANRDMFLFAPGSGSDRITDFEDNLDRLRLDDALWGGGLTAAQVVATFARTAGPNTVFDFGGGNVLILAGLADPTALVNDIEIV